MLNQRYPSGVDWTRSVHRISFFLFGLVTSFWVFYVINMDFAHPGLWDWLQFQDTARLLLSGRMHEIYPGITPDVPFFYPPYLIPMLAPLGLLSRPGAYAAIIIVQMAAMGCSLWLLSHLKTPREERYATAVLVALSFPSWTHTIIAGHLSALYLLFLVLALWLWMRGRPLLAGASLSLLMLKPNYGLPILPFLLTTRRWSPLAGWIGGFALLVACSFVVEPGIWAEYLWNYRRFSSMIAAEFPMWKQQTIYAFWRTALGLPQSPLTIAVWLASIIPLLAMVAALWYRTRPDPERLPRLFGIMVLAIISCNPYSTPYDGLMLVLPGMVWYLYRASYRSPACRLICGLAIMFVYIYGYINFWLLQGGWALVGPALAVWMIADAWDLWRAQVALPWTRGLCEDAETTMAPAFD